MMSMRAFCCFLIFFILQFHTKVSNADYNSQGPQAANCEGLGGITSSQFANKAKEGVIENRKMLMLANLNVKAKINGLGIESKEMARKIKNKKRLTKTVSLTADYSDPGHHPPRHN